MKKILAFAFIVLLFVSTTYQADALRQVAGKPEFSLKPGQSDSFEWGLASDDSSKVITVELSSSGDGSEFLSFEKTITIDPLKFKYTTVTVNIPDDYPGDITLTPRLFATEFGQKGATTVINVQMAKTVTLNIAPNDNPKLWVDWDAQKLDEEPKPEPEPKAEPVQEVTKEEPQKQMEIKKSEEQTDPEPQPSCGPGTVLQNGICVVEEQGGGCLIATAAFGSELAPQVQQLRELRDSTLLQTTSGSAFMTGFNQFYYSFSPTISDLERENPMFKETVKLAITPLITSLSLLNYVDLNSEESVLGYGIGIILLNIGMYFVAPAVILYSIRRKLI